MTMMILCYKKII